MNIIVFRASCVFLTIRLLYAFVMAGLGMDFGTPARRLHYARCGLRRGDPADHGM